MDYQEIEAAIQQAPTTWIPALMVACIKTGIEKSVWRPGQIGVFATRIERQTRWEAIKQREASDQKR